MLIKIKSKYEKEKEAQVKRKFAFLPVYVSETAAIWLERYYIMEFNEYICYGRSFYFSSKVKFFDYVRDVIEYNLPPSKKIYCRPKGSNDNENQI